MDVRNRAHTEVPAPLPIQFLRRFHPAGPWVLTAISPESKQIESKTFGPKSAKAASKWVTKHNAERNIYFSVNLPKCRLTKKAARADIHAVHWLHVDIDARAGEPLAAELERIKILLTEQCPVPAPTAIVFSGGGYQAFWRLSDPVMIPGDLDAEEIARYNKQLEIELGGDACSNIDRIMRLPGTTNWPNAKKVARGRVPALAKVISFDESRVYDLSQFKQAPASPAKSPSTISSTIPPDSVVRLQSVEGLDNWNVPDRVKVIVVQGHDPDNPKAVDNSRSAWLFDAVCQLVRAEVPDDVIFSIITDPDFGISASVRDKGRSMASYATRQITRAHEEADDPVLREMNDLHCVVLDYGSQARVATEKWDSVFGRRNIVLQRPAEFYARYTHRPLQVGNQTVDRGKWWFKHPMRRQAESLVYLPGEDAPGDLNLWQGFAVEARAGDKHESYLAHIRENICSGDERNYSYTISWMAKAVQKPNEVGATAIALRGKRGTGKSHFAKGFGRLWGRHFLQVSDAKHLVGNSFNAHLRGCSVLFADEAYWTGDARNEGTLKALITEETIMIERKGVDAQPARNVIHLIMASNENWVVPAGAHERRFFVLDVSNARQQDSAYFGAITADLDAGGAENLLHYLQHLDLTGFDVRRVPWTEALSDQIERKLSPAEDLVLEMLQTGRLPGWIEADTDGRVEIAAWDLVPMDLKKRDEIAARSLAKKIGWVLKGIVDPDEAQRADRLRRRCLPQLEGARARWKAKYGFEITGPPFEWIKPESAGMVVRNEPESVSGMGRNTHTDEERPAGPANTVVPFPELGAGKRYRR